MTSDGVVVGLDPVEGGGFEVFERGPGAGVDEFLLVGREERLRDGVVVTDPGLPQGPPDLVLAAVGVELGGGGLAAAIGVNQNSG